MTTDTTALIAALEAATGPDRTLDYRIAIAAGVLDGDTEPVQRLIAGEHVAASMRALIDHVTPRYTVDAETRGRVLAALRARQGGAA